MLRRLLHRPRQHDDFGPPSDIPGLSRSAGASGTAPVPVVPPDDYVR